MRSKTGSFSSINSNIPLLVNLMPLDDHFTKIFTMPGGLPVVIKELSSFLDPDVLTVNGKSHETNINNAECYDRGYVNLDIKHVEQAHLGADMDFLTGKSGSVVKRESH